MLQNIRNPGAEKVCVYLEFMVDRVDKACSKEINPKKWYTCLKNFTTCYQLSLLNTKYACNLLNIIALID